MLALLGASCAARAQFVFEEEVLPPRVVAWRLADRGFSGLSRPRFDGRVYVVDAVGPAGAPVRLFVDPMTGAIVGRRPIGAPEAVARLERPAPGFGWTEDEVVPRRAMQPVPSEEGPAVRPQRRPGGEALRPEANPDGVNPESAGRTPPKRVARGSLARTPELKTPPRTSPEAPAPRLAPAETAKVDPKAATNAAPKADPKPAPVPETKAASVETAPSPPPAAQPVASPKPADAAVAEAAKPAAKDWKDPPTDKKPVRVIGGATIVPGQSD